MFVWKRVLLLLLAIGLPIGGLAHISTVLSHGRSPIGPIIISEVAWSGTSTSANDEWIELHNPTAIPITLTDWLLTDNGSLNVTLTGVVPPHGFFLLERTDDTTVPTIPADQLYVGSLSNAGEQLELWDASGQLVDTANADGGAWGAGTGSPSYQTMERLAPTAIDIDDHWVDSVGTPRLPNLAWATAPAFANLTVQQVAPARLAEPFTLTYRLSVSNTGAVTAAAVVLTNTLPTSATYLLDNSGFPLSQHASQLVWQIGTLPPNTAASFYLTAAVAPDFFGWLTNTLKVSTPTSETTRIDNQASAVTFVGEVSPPQVVIDAVLYHGQAKSNNQGDEAVRLYNMGAVTADLSGWQLSDGTSTAVIPEGNTLPPRQTLWLAKDGLSFRAQFGFAPDLAHQGHSPDIGQLTGTWPGFADSGDEVILRDALGDIRDVLVYEDGNTTQAGWLGEAVRPYKINHTTAARGQLLYRQRDQQTGFPLTDTQTVADWAQALDDPINGRHVAYPGWDLSQFFHTFQVTETAVLTIAIAPDNAYEVLRQQIASAQEEIAIETHTFESIALADDLIAALERGVSVTILLEGGPPGGIADQQRYICQQIEQVGGACWFMINDPDRDIYDRYTYLHAKFWLIDGQRVVISSENLSPNSLPDDEKSDGTFGRRGVLIITDAPSVVAHVQQIFAADFDPANHHDIARYETAHPTYGAPPAHFVPLTQTGGTTYTVRHAMPFVLHDTFAFELVQSPENSLRDRDGLLGLLRRAQAGDTILVQQLGERPYWTDATTSNPRFATYIDAARRGATVRLLLDDYFNNPTEPTSNEATCRYVRELAQREALDLQCATANPTGLGIHNKMVLAEIDGRGYLHVGSLNGTEQAHKGNRELAIQIQTDEGYRQLADLFERDWPHQSVLPVVFHAYIGPARQPLISEVLYNPFGPDGAEFVEIANPTPYSWDLTGYALGDAQQVTDFADVRRFPAGTQLAPHATLVVAQQATIFEEQFGIAPDFEILETTPHVPNLVDDPEWGSVDTFLQLGNSGDVLILRDPANNLVDVVPYGSATYGNLVSCAPIATGHSLRRNPYWRDTDNCVYDFEDWPVPDPNRLP